MDDLQRRKDNSIKKLAGKYKDKENELMDKINFLRHEKTQIMKNYDNLITEKDRELETMRTDFENYKIANERY